MKKHGGMSLLEIVLAMVLFAIIVPSILGIFFANADLSIKLLAQKNVGEMAEDMKSFVRLSSYENIYDLARNGKLLTVEEIEENGICTRNFIAAKNLKANNFIIKFELIDLNEKIMPKADVAATCAFPLKFEVYRAKSGREPIAANALPQTCNLEYATFMVKNR
ncbi:MAG: type II secretion system GspH family protein [Puniceicoccales bacterium]|jgi:type II secretory pathway pseudopilin PulG|nr:type II secretion system GspH family protein [Puniceicoccales bacterium]